MTLQAYRIESSPKAKNEASCNVRRLYTAGLCKRGKPEMVCLDCPQDKVKRLAATMNFLSERELKDKQTIQKHGLWLKSTSITGEDKEAFVLLNMPLCDHKYSQVIRLDPIFNNTLERWGGPPEDSPDGQFDLVDSILYKWMRQGRFVRYRDGNPKNNGLFNLKSVNLYDAMMHPEWKVDWVKKLTYEECKYVRKHNLFFARTLLKLHNVKKGRVS